jgi:6-phosphogluconate dehydrogenase
MKIGMIGLGRMGANMTRRLIAHGHQCVVYDRNRSKVEDLLTAGALPAGELAELTRALEPPRVVWLMLPAGDPTEQTLGELTRLLDSGDTIIDGGNSHYSDSVRRATEAARKGLRFSDVGVSGGIWGLERGYCLMIGGSRETDTRLDPIFQALAPEGGTVFCGPPGAGHFVKMVHNGIEYGMMQALAEGLQILQGASHEELPEGRRFEFDVGAITEAWRHGSVVSSWLLDLVAAALKRDPRLAEFEGRVADSGEGRWALEAAIEEGVPASVLAAALFARFRSREQASFADKVLSAMRRGFGGHTEPRKVA